jgi:subtilase family serine protease
MIKAMRTLPLLALAFAFPIALLSGAAAMAQNASPTVRIVNRIDETDLATLKGNTHPFANAKNDRGLVSSTLPMTDLILVLNRGAAQQAAFDKFVESQYDSTSPNFHRWLTPGQVGQNYGASDTDIATISNWLTGHGFSIGEVTKDHLSIRFSGTAAQVQSAFHTEIHILEVKGVPHIGNMSDPQIPSALAPVVVGVKALHNFFPRPQHRMGHQVTLSSEAGGWQRVNPMAATQNLTAAAKPSTDARTVHPDFTINVPASGGTSGSPAYTEEDVSPYDFATIYNVLPLWNKGIDGTGQTIAIAGTSDINQNDIATFRTFFGLPTNLAANTPQIVHPNPSLPGGDDPGICTSTVTGAVCTIDDLVENSLDVEWSGAVAKNAQLILVTAASQSATDDTLYDAESYIVNNVTAHVVSVSYGECELFNGTSGNVEYNTLWQDAASEGIAVFVAAGDSGSTTCEGGQDVSGPPYVAEYGLSVSGLASTPWNTAVGGTDFNWCPPLTLFNGGTCASAPYWASSNTAPAGASNASISAMGYVPEMPWNETCSNPFMLPLLIGLATALDIPNVVNTEQSCNLIANNINDLDEEYPYGVDLLDVAGGGGGVSNCTTSDGSTVASCSGGYLKPSWQAGVTGIPSDGFRDLPDVSFFSADGFVSESAYLICVEENGGEPCTYSADAEPFASEVGGTSASTPPMAAVMALINQKAGSAQGFANPGLYALAAKQTYSSCSSESVTTSSSCYFNDIDAGPSTFASPGTIAQPCDNGANTQVSPDCVAKYATEGTHDQVGISGTTTEIGYNAGTGFDLATGLGSLNVANVVNAWAAVPASAGGTAPVSVTVTPASATTLASAPLTVTGTVASSPSGGATPTGTLILTAGSFTSPATALSASGGYSITIPANSLGAGTDIINAAYSGDPTYDTGSGQAQETVEGNGVTISLTTPAIAVTPAGGVAPGATATAAVTVSAVAGFAGTVTVTCSEVASSSPANSATDAPNCTGGGPTLTVTLPNSAAQVLNFSVTTTLPSTTTVVAVKQKAKASAEKHSLWTTAGGAVLALLVFLGIPARRRGWRQMLGALLVMVALGALAGLGGCGGSGSGTTTTIETDPGTSAGTYTFNVQAVTTPSVTPTVSATFTVTVN